MLLINKNKVTHIRRYKETEGVYTYYDGVVKLFYMPSRKPKWYEIDTTHKEGYYENGVQSYCAMYLSVEKVEQSNKVFVKEGSIFSKPFIEIFAGGVLIHTEYFNSEIELENHLNQHYNEVNVIYN